MIQLHSDYLVFKTTDGLIPCTAKQVVVELTGSGAAQLDPELVQNATDGVLHYFKTEEGKDQVTLAEFSSALAKVLRGFGFDVASEEDASGEAGVLVVEADLRLLACESGKGYELAFFSRLRVEMRQQLMRCPRVLRFTGLRPCVKQLAGARRWTERCQRLSDHIVEYLRLCLSEHQPTPGCALVVR